MSRAIIKVVLISFGLCSATGLSAQLPTDEPTLLPFITTDAVVRRNLITGRLMRTTGVIEDLSGDTIQFRRNNSRIELIRLRETAEIQFRKSPEYMRGLQLMNGGDMGAAVTAFESACESEARKWVVCEIRGSAARALLSLKRYPEVIRQIEEAVRLDPKTRHVALLPLVWDERLPESDRFQADVSELKSASPLVRLTAASALLHETESRSAAVEELTRLLTSGQPGIQQLAETQLWRLQLLNPERLRQSDTSFWKTRVHELQREVRAGAELVLGRALMLQHDYDGAAMSLLWMPTMDASDPPTAAAAMLDACTALRLAGRAAEADQMAAELVRRFPETSAARQIRNGGAGATVEP